MRITARPRSRTIKFNITPMIDVVFLLVIFFLVTAHFAQSQEVDAVDLPVATQIAEIEDSPRRLTITVLAVVLIGDVIRDHLDPKLRGRLKTTAVT